MEDLNKLQVRLILKSALFFAIFLGTVLGLSAIGPGLGWTRQYGLPIWAAAMLVVAHFLFAPELRPYLRNPKAIYGIEAFLLLLAALGYCFPVQAAWLANLVEEWLL
ncbi:MAG: hypothetical protein J0I12_23395 [Candidatus Eremiobacteraeota bacterium]|nr:hypothetical protein [Candidatus Eremiobacteraeota bacterium]